MKISIVNLSKFSKINRIVKFSFKRETLSFKKLSNAVIVLSQMVLKRPKIHGYPFIVKIEPTNRCNLRCKECYSNDFENPFPKGFMPVELFRKIIDEMGPYLFVIKLYLWGEPLLNKDIYEMISYARKKNVSISLSSNFHLLDNESADKMVKSGLNHLIVAIDGLTQEIYEKNRIGGNLNRVISNLQLLIDKRKELKSSTPFIEWQYVITKWNEYQINDAEILAKKMGVDKITFIPDGYDTNALNEENKKKYAFLKRKPKQPCYWLWCMSTIQWNGTIIPCCYLQDSYAFSFGNVSEKSFKKIWNDVSYVSARKSFTNKNRNISAGEKGFSVPSVKEWEAYRKNSNLTDTMCHICNYYQVL
ncbi:MAG: radical SAM protein [bacterium]|nr:radical SAM protein [bacterium]